MSGPLQEKRRREREAGITLLEIMIVLAIMALVVGLAAPRIIENFGRAKARTAELQMQQIQGSVQLFYIDVGRYPTEAEGLQSLVQPPSGVPDWDGPYLNGDEDTLDPWGRPYFYRYPAEDGSFDIETLGRDGQPGGSAEDSDIVL